MKPLLVQPAEGSLAAPCACCAGEPGLRGFVYEEDEARAIYFVQPAGVPNFPLAKLGIVTGAWGNGAATDSRSSVLFICKPGDAGPSIEPGDPSLPEVPEFGMLGVKLTRQGLLQHDLLHEFKELARAIIDQDWRLEAIRERGAVAPVHRRFSAEGL